MLRTESLGIGCVDCLLPAVFLLVFSRVSLCQNAQKDTINARMDTVEVVHELAGKQMTGRTFRSSDIRTIPGSMDDPVRILDLSAEVVSNSDLQAVPIIGGDQADGVLTLMDGFPLVYPYRWLGSLSLFNPLTTDRIELLTAGYPVSSGGYAPTAIRVSSKSDYSGRPDVQTDVSTFVSSVLLQLPVSDSLRWSAKIAARASNIGLETGLLSGSSRERLQAFVPNLQDVQFYLGEMPSTNLYAFQEGLASREHGSLMSVDRTFDYSWQKEFAGSALIASSDLLSSEHRLSWTHDDISLSTLVPIQFIGSGRFGINSQFTTVRLQDQFQYPILPAVNATAGTDILYSFSDVGFETFSSWLNNRSPLRSAFTDISGFTELHWALSGNASATVGVRETRFGFVRQFGFEPRGVFVYDFGNNASVHLSLGQYLQCPSDFEILHGFLMFLAAPTQTPLMMLMSEYRNNLQLETHNLAALDVEAPTFQTRTLDLDARLSLYYKKTQSLIMPARYPGVFTPLDTMSFEPLQSFRGIKWGMGLSSTAHFVPLDLSITASLFSHHNHIIDDRTGNEYSTVGDVPIVGKMLLQFAPPGWRVSLLYQYSTGSPTTDGYFLKSDNLLGQTLYLPLWKELNSDRVPDYHRLDLTLAKNWRGLNWKVEVLCSILNLLGDKNVSNYNYVFSEDGEDYVKKTPVMNTLPFVPNLEIRCEYSL